MRLEHLLPHPGRKLALLPAAVVIVAVMNLWVPYLAISPGPADAVLPLVSIEGAETHKPQGKILLTTVSLHSVRLAEAIQGWLDGDTDVVPQEVIVPPGSTDQEVNRENIEQMEESKLAAAVSALTLLGYPVRYSGARVSAVLRDGPSGRVLKPGDVIVGVDGSPVEDVDGVVTAIRRGGVGARLALTVLRKGKQLELNVTAGPRPGAETDPIIGVEIRTVPELPLTIKVDSGRIGGPSAGLMFALAIVDLLRPEDLTQGRTIAGTGVITLDGRVEPVGGVGQKVAAAERQHAAVFLVPTDELRLACRSSRHMRVIGVDTLSEAVDALRAVVPTVGRSCETTRHSAVRDE